MMNRPFRSFGPVLFAYGGLIGGGYLLAKTLIVPVFLEGSSRPTNSAAVSPAPLDLSKLKLLGDTFSGYSTFRNGSFQDTLEESGTQLDYDDEFNQAARAKALGDGRADFIVTTLDQFLRHRPQGRVVGLIDRTIGADAALLNSKKYPQLKSLIDLEQLVDRNKSESKKLSIVYAGDTPSEYLALVLDTKFEAFNLADFNIIEVADASDAWDVLQDQSNNVAIAILWEPFVAQAEEQGYTVVLSSRDTPDSIIDVLVASDRRIAAQPEQVSNLLETYYRRIDSNMRSASELQEQVAQDGDLSPSDAATVLSGIDFFTATESKKWMDDGTLTDRINSIANVLVQSGRLEAAPDKPSELYTTQLLTKSAQNTQALIRLVQPDNTILAAKLEGTVPGQGTTQPPITSSFVRNAPSIGNLKVQGEVKFLIGSIQLANDSLQTLEQLAAEISEFNPDTVAIRVIGHTSRTGPTTINQLLSQQRANVVAKYLQSKGLKQQIIAEGKGTSEPLPNLSPADANNQRTEIRLVRINRRKVNSL